MSAVDPGFVDRGVVAADVSLPFFEYRDRHGYGIIQEFERRTGQKGALLPGSLYNTMARMLSAGLVEESADRPGADEDDERRRYYRVTPLARAVAIAETRRLKALVQLAEEQEMAPETG